MSSYLSFLETSSPWRSFQRLQHYLYTLEPVRSTFVGTPTDLEQATPRRQHLGQRAPRPRPETIVFLDQSISIWGRPSRGGLIVLEQAGPLDFDYLGLDRIEPPLHHSGSQEEEDLFCQQLLRLGARWFDSRDRYGFVADIADEREYEHQLIERGDQPAPSKMERRWVSVGIEENGFWVLEHDLDLYGAGEKDNFPPNDASRVMLAKTMEEKCEILKNMGAKFYESVSEYQGLACINAWNVKMTGEFGPLVRHK